MFLLRPICSLGVFVLSKATLTQAEILFACNTLENTADISKRVKVCNIIFIIIRITIDVLTLQWSNKSAIFRNAYALENLVFLLPFLRAIARQCFWSEGWSHSSLDLFQISFQRSIILLVHCVDVKGLINFSFLLSLLGNPDMRPFAIYQMFVLLL